MMHEEELLPNDWVGARDSDDNLNKVKELGGLLAGFFEDVLYAEGKTVTEISEFTLGQAKACIAKLPQKYFDGLGECSPLVTEVLIAYKTDVANNRICSQILDLVLERTNSERACNSFASESPLVLALIYGAGLSVIKKLVSLSNYFYTYVREDYYFRTRIEVGSLRQAELCLSEGLQSHLYSDDDVKQIRDWIVARRNEVYRNGNPVMSLLYTVLGSISTIPSKLSLPSLGSLAIRSDSLRCQTSEASYTERFNRAFTVNCRPV